MASDSDKCGFTWDSRRPVGNGHSHRRKWHLCHLDEGHHERQHRCECGGRHAKEAS